jgi:hypothetical protein
VKKNYQDENKKSFTEKYPTRSRDDEADFIPIDVNNDLDGHLCFFSDSSGTRYRAGVELTDCCRGAWEQSVQVA